MAKYLGPKCKLCRREGEKLMLKGERCYTPKCAIVKKNYPPGIHGPKGRARQSSYCIELREKQKAKRIYNLQEQQFALTFKKARRQKGDAGENLMKLLETRLDNAIYRLGLASSRSEARVLIVHQHFTVNDKTVDIPSYQVNTGDIIKIKPSRKNDKIFVNLTEKLKKFSPPSWLSLDSKELTAKILHLPAKDEVELKINTQLIVEFYSR